MGGWQVSTIATLQSGLPIDTTSWDSAGTNFVSSSNRLSCSAGVNPVLDNANADHYLNPAAFRNTLAREFGNCARNNLVRPRQTNFEISAIKDFRVTVPQAVQFRMEISMPQTRGMGSPNATGVIPMQRQLCHPSALAKSAARPQPCARSHSR